MKKILSTVLAVLITAAVIFPTTALAANESFKLYYTFDKNSYDVGDTVTAQLHLDRTDASDGYNLYAFEDQILIDKIYLTYIDSSDNANNAADFRISTEAVYYNNQYNMLRVNYNSMGAKVTRPASLVVAELKFTAINAVKAGELVNSEPKVYTYPTAAAALDAKNGSYTIIPTVPVYNITFAGGANAAGSAPASFLLKKAPEGYSFTLPENSYTKIDGKFVGWSDGKTVYQPGDSYIMGAAHVTFTAQWKMLHSVAFAPGNNAAGQVPGTAKYYEGNKIALPTKAALAREGYTFSGWKYGDKVYQPGDTFTMPDSDVTFTAQWKAVEAGGAGAADSWSNPFIDVKDGAWYYDYVKYAQTKGLMGSVGGSRFDPDGLMTRAMVVTILYRAAASPAVTASSPFSDVPTGKWYTDAVVWASENKLVTGYGEGKFGPADTLTRQQMLAILWRYAGSPASADQTAAAAKFSDWGSVAAWARSAAAWATEKSVVNGMDGRLVPSGSATRAQFAAIMTRIDSAK